ncbi:MAG TPA: FliI/YscN family ATPase [Sphingopyxis sp.]|nr:FliI/YscN family ATPase [Sphingopyxis sp.]
MMASALLREIETQDFAAYRGKVTHISDARIEARGPLARLGDYCEIETGAAPLLAEVVAIEAERLVLMPLATGSAVALGATVTASQRFSRVTVGNGLANRAIDALGRPIDGRGALTDIRQLDRQAILAAPLDRITPDRAVATGIRAIDTLLPLGAGQRIGIFAASGVGKTSLVEQLSQQIECDHVILCLVGERGREVEALWAAHRDRTQGARTSIVAATSDESASMRVRAVEQALAMAEYWRAGGKHVVLFVDSATRLAFALRELGLAAGEPPALRALTPNIFTHIPRIVERCGALRGGGAISAIFTILSETDDVDDPIVELMKSLLDGHIVLSRRLAEKGHFPAIDIGASVSRLATRLLTGDALALARQAQSILASHEEARTMIESGIYRPGSSDAIDRAIDRMPALTRYLQQGTTERDDPADAERRLRAALTGEVGRE